MREEPEQGNLIDTNTVTKLGFAKKFLRVSLKTQIFFTAGIFLILLFCALYLTRDIIVPFLFALFFSFLLEPSVKLLKKLYIPLHIGAAIVILISLFIVGSGFYALVQPATAWINKGPEAVTKIDQKLSKLANFISKPAEAISNINENISALTKKIQIEKQKTVIAKQSFLIGTIFTSTWQFLLELTLTILILYFLLISNGDFFLGRVVSWLSAMHQKKEIVNMARQIQDDVCKYLYSRTVINVGLAIVVSVLMYILGMPNPILWGIMAGILEFIPYVGAILSAFIIALVALFSFSELYALLVIFLYALVIFIEGNIIAPIIIGHIVRISPLSLFLNIIFWGWLWGIAGAFIAAPIAVMVKIIFETFIKEK